MKINREYKLVIIMKGEERKEEEKEKLYVLNIEEMWTNMNVDINMEM